MREILQSHGIDVETLALLGENQDGVYCVRVPYEQALNIWKTFRKIVELTNYWPVILTAEMEIVRMLEQIEEYRFVEMNESGRKVTNFSVQGLIDMASTVAVDEWVRTEIEYERRDAESMGEQFDFPHSAWPQDIQPDAEEAVDPYSGIGLPWYDREQPAPNVFIGLCPTRDSWQVPAFLRFGGFNGCPHPHEHVAFLKHWYEQYKIEVVVMGRDVLEVQVPCPPSTREQALVLAQEQLMYNRELDWNQWSVEQIAAMLMRERTWFFWWD